MCCKIIFAICVLDQCVVGQTWQTCSNIKSISNLNLERFRGTWFEIETAVRNSRLLNSTSCGRLDTESIGSGSLSINSSRIVGDKLACLIGNATVSPTNPGILSVFIVHGGVNLPLEMNVLDIDYENHVLLLLCVQEGDLRSILSWKMSRSRNGYSSISVKAIDAAVSANAYISNITWRKMDQSVETCGSSASVTAASLLLAVVTVVIITARI